MINYKNLVAVPPGETLKEQLEIKKIPQKDFAKRIGRTEKYVIDLIKGNAPLDAEIAIKLENIIQIPAKFWMSYETDYRLTLAKINEIKQIDEEIEIALKIPHNEMNKLGWINKHKDHYSNVIELRNYFEVSNLKYIPEIPYLCAVSFRKLDNGKANKYALFAWLQRARIRTSKIETKSFRQKYLQSRLDEFRSLVLLDPKDFYPKLQEKFADCGVAFVIERQLKGTKAHGATFWIANNKPAVVVSIRNKSSDIFWFSLFHEIGHLLHSAKNETFVSFEVDEETKSEAEKDADYFAANTLIPKKEYESFLGYHQFGEIPIQSFAKSIDTSPDIVLGRLQHDGFLRYGTYNYLRTQLEWTNDAYQN